MNTANRASAKKALRLIVAFGIVSLFGDIVYEGARSISGPFLASLAATAGIIGLVTGLGEFLGYGLRYLSGLYADRSRAYWPLTLLGYGLVLAIPLLAVAPTWQVAAFLLIIERIGKAVRTPARDTILSYATRQVGRGVGFGLHEALDQIGAVVGPLVFTVVLALRENAYRTGFAILAVPAALLVLALAATRARFGAVDQFEPQTRRTQGESLTGSYAAYAVFAFVSLCGFAGFPLIAFHLTDSHVLLPRVIPLLYILAMAVDGFSAIAVGMLYDRVGLVSLVAVPLVSLALAPMAFSGSPALAVAGVALWGIGMAVQETIMRAAIADLTPVARRATAYGLFNTIYGAAWFVAGVSIGMLYEHARGFLIPYVFATQAVSLLLFVAFVLRRTPAK